MARVGSTLRAGRRSLSDIFISAIFISIILPFPALDLIAAQAPQPESNGILPHLNAAISWYRRVASLDVTAGQPSDVLYLESARRAAGEALQLAFEASLAQAELAKESSGKPLAAGAQDAQQGIAKALADAGNRAAQTQSQIGDLNKQIDSARGKKRQELISQRDSLEGQLDLEKTIQDSIQKISSVAATSESSSGLAGQINQLKQSVPEVFANTSKPQTVAAGSSKSSRAQSSGLFGQTSILFGQMRDVHDIDQLMAETVRLRNTADKIDVPLRDSLKQLVQQGRQIVNQPPTSDPSQIAATRKQFEQLTTQFKQISAAAVPLRQEMILLDQCHGDLLEWRNSISAEYGRVLRSLLGRVAGILIALAFVFFLSEIWRRTTYRYVHDSRRRRQLLLVRRFVTGFLMIVVIVLGFLSEFSSLATFAGFLTAGIAVALQTVILSVAAYFFLIGRYGVRVGDRLTVGGVTGDVVEVGLVRLYLMELAGTGIDLHPTGRVVVFSNSVMFQSTPFFKQLPGTAYAWHEVAVTLAPDANPSIVEHALMDAVTGIFEKYRHSIDRQHAIVERLLDAPLAAPAPRAHLQFTEAGLEFVVRYPVEISHAADVDDQITRKLMEVIGSEPELKAAVSGSPKLRAPIKA